MMRELTTNELRDVLQAAKSALPDDAKGNDIILLIAARTTKGVWVNRISTCIKDVANEHLMKWAMNILNKDKFGERNPN